MAGKEDRKREGVGVGVETDGAIDFDSLGFSATLGGSGAVSAEESFSIGPAETSVGRKAVLDLATSSVCCNEGSIGEQETRRSASR